MTSPNHRRAGIIAGPIAAALLLAGCSSDSRLNVTSMFAVAESLVSGGPEGTRVSLKEAASVPFASIGARIGTGAEQMLILANTDGGDQTWIGSGNIILLTHNGRLVQTGGLADDLPRLYAIAENPALPHTQPGEIAKSHWLTDFPKRNVYSTRVDCEAQGIGFEDITVLGKAIRTLRVDETCTAAAIEWVFVNQYWISPASGVVWQSRQTFSPIMDPMTIVALRAIAPS